MGKNTEKFAGNCSDRVRWENVLAECAPGTFCPPFIIGTGHCRRQCQPARVLRADEGDALRQKRIDSLYRRDGSMAVRESHENEEIKALYREFYGKPLSGLAEKMLHTFYTEKSGMLDGVGID